jgi:hypothetical protein
MEDDRDDVRRFADLVLSLLVLHDQVHQEHARHLLPTLKHRTEEVRALALHHALPVTIPFPEGGAR